MTTAKQLLQQQLRDQVLSRVVALIEEHDITDVELEDYVRNRYTSVAEQLQARRNRQDLRAKRSAAAYKSQEKRKERLEQYFTRRKKAQELPDVVPDSPPVETLNTEETPQEAVLDFLGGI